MWIREMVEYFESKKCANLDEAESCGIQSLDISWIRNRHNIRSNPNTLSIIFMELLVDLVRSKRLYPYQALQVWELRPEGPRNVLELLVILNDLVANIWSNEGRSRIQGSVEMHSWSNEAVTTTREDVSMFDGAAQYGYNLQNRNGW